MPRRFSDEPINLIHRIPTPEQLSAARPLKRSFSQAIVESGAACVRGMGEVLAQIARVGGMAQTAVSTKAASPSCLDQYAKEPMTGSVERLDPGSGKSEVVDHRNQAMAPSYREGEVTPPESGAVPAAVQPEEVAELRAYLLSQQQDIARLSAQIQELKSLVVSQQQVLVYLGKELEIGSLSPMAAGVASAPAKRNRPVREKPGMKDKAVSRKDAPTSSSLSL